MTIPLSNINGSRRARNRNASGVNAPSRRARPEEAVERACARPHLFTMDIRHDETHGSRAFILNPMRAWPIFGESLSRMKLLRRTVVMVISQHAGEHIDDCGITAMAVETYMPAGRDHRTAEA